MPIYMLDTDISSYIMKRSDKIVLRQLQLVLVRDICISAITESELMYEVEISPRQQQGRAALDAFLKHVEALDYPDQAAPHYGQIRAALKLAGKLIDANDLLIAARARCLGFSPVTNNTRAFSWAKRPLSRELDKTGSVISIGRRAQSWLLIR